jgi:hypothetical protein
MRARRWCDQDPGQGKQALPWASIAADQVQCERPLAGADRDVGGDRGCLLWSCLVEDAELAYLYPEPLWRSGEWVKNI